MAPLFRNPSGIGVFLRAATPSPTPTPVAPVAPTPVAPVAPTPVAPVAPTPVAPVAPVAPTPVAPVAPTPVAPVAPTPVAPVAPTPVAPVAPTPVAPTPVATVYYSTGCCRGNPNNTQVTGTGFDAITAGDNMDGACVGSPGIVDSVQTGTYPLGSPNVPVINCAPAPTPVAPVAPTPVAPVAPTPVAPVAPTPVAPVAPTPVAPVAPTPVAPTPTPSCACGDAQCGGSFGNCGAFCTNQCGD